MGGASVRRQVMVITAGVLLGAAMLVGCGSGADGRIVLSFTTANEGANQHRVAAAECTKASGGRYTIE